MGVEGSTEWTPFGGRNGAVDLPIDDLIHFEGYGPSLGSNESIRSPTFHQKLLSMDLGGKIVTSRIIS